MYSIDPKLASNFLKLLNFQSRFHVIYNPYSIIQYDSIMYDSYKEMIKDIHDYFIGKKFESYEIIEFTSTTVVRVSTRNGMVTREITLKELSTKELRNDWKRINTSN